MLLNEKIEQNRQVAYNAITRNVIFVLETNNRFLKLVGYE